MPQKSYKNVNGNLVELTEKEILEIEEAKANLPKPTYQELRANEYLEKGLTTDKLIVALWEKVVEGRSEEADKLQAERVKVKEKYPKG